jgi:hypothetical protein
MPLALSASVVGAAAVAVLIGLSAGISYAQAGGGAGAATSNEPAFIKNLHITGFFQNTTSTWLNSNAIEYNNDRFGNQNKNSLAAESNLIQVDVNDDFHRERQHVPTRLGRVRAVLSVGDTLQHQ